MKEGFIYIWYDRWRKMFYIGCHWGYENDGYICSSNRMRDAHRRRPQDFKRRIIQRGITREKLLDEEFKWLSLISDDELGKRYYNLKKHHYGHWTNLPDENRKLSIREKLSRSQMGKTLSEEHKARTSQSLKGRKHTKEHIEARARTRIGHVNSEEHKRKISQTLTGKKQTKEHIENAAKARVGLRRSLETKEKISNARVGMKFSEEHRRNLSLARKAYFARKII